MKPIRMIAAAIALLLALPAMALALSLTPTSSDVFYFDHAVTPQIRCSYFSYKVTNDSASPVADLWLSLRDDASDCAAIAPTEPLF